MFENVASSSPEGSEKVAKNKRSKNSPKKPKKPCKTRLFGIGCIFDLWGWRPKQDSNLWHVGLRCPKCADADAAYFNRCSKATSLFPPQAAVGVLSVNSTTYVDWNVQSHTLNSFYGKTKTTADAVAFVLAPQTGLEPVTLRLTAACSTDWAIRAYIYVHWSSAQYLFSGTALLWLQWTKFRIRQRLTLPGRLQPSTISAEKLNFCVRHGNRWSFSPLSPEILTAFLLFLSSFSMHLHNRRSPI